MRDECLMNGHWSGADVTKSRKLFEWLTTPHAELSLLRVLFFIILAWNTRNKSKSFLGLLFLREGNFWILRLPLRFLVSPTSYTNVRSGKWPFYEAQHYPCFVGGNRNCSWGGNCEYHNNGQVVKFLLALWRRSTPSEVESAEQPPLAFWRCLRKVWVKLINNRSAEKGLQLIYLTCTLSG